MAELNWTDAQWQRVNDAVTDAFTKASVASAFLPIYGPLTGSVETVRNERLLSNTRGTTISLETDHGAVNLKLVNLTVHVKLSSEQVAEEALSNAMLAFRRAANILALEEDRIVFRGYRRGFEDENSKLVKNQVAPQKGLADLDARRGFSRILVKSQPRDPAYAGEAGQAVVFKVVEAIGKLEEKSNPGPFACVLANDLYSYVHTPSDSLVLPADRITPQLKGGPLLRSSGMRDGAGIVVSLANSAVDIVLGTPPTAQFLQRRADAKYLFRVYERFVLRIRDKSNLPVAGFRLASGVDDDGEKMRIVKLGLPGIENALMDVVRRRSIRDDAASRAVEIDSSGVEEAVRRAATRLLSEALGEAPPDAGDT